MYHWFEILTQEDIASSETFFYFDGLWSARVETFITSKDMSQHGLADPQPVPVQPGNNQQQMDQNGTNKPKKSSRSRGKRYHRLKLIFNLCSINNYSSIFIYCFHFDNWLLNTGFVTIERCKLKGVWHPYHTLGADGERNLSRRIREEKNVK